MFILLLVGKFYFMCDMAVLEVSEYVKIIVTWCSDVQQSRAAVVVEEF